MKNSVRYLLLLLCAALLASACATAKTSPPEKPGKAAVSEKKLPDEKLSEEKLPDQKPEPVKPVPEATAPAAANRNLTGYWSGNLDLGDSTLTLIFSIKKKGDSYAVSLDIPQQNAKNFPATSAREEAGKLIAEFSTIGARLTCVPAEGDTMKGTWGQSGLEFEILLEKRENSITLRPQDPVKPYPYAEEEVVFLNEKAGVMLAGTLTYPKAEGKFPAVLFVSGSGPQNRDEEIFNHRPFLVLADYLSRLGFAVLRYDDRGTGQSTGVYNAATTLDFAEDALAGVAFLSSLPMVDKNNLGVLGHSEGGLIAPMLAVSTDLVSFIVLLAAPGFPGEDVIILQNRAIMLASGQSMAQVNQANAINRDLHTIIKNEPDLKTAETRIREYLGRLNFSEPQINALVAQTTSSWFKTYLMYDPRPVLAKVKVPVLALNGSRDLQVTPAENLASLDKALKEGGNTRVTLRELEGLNHLFQPARTGLMNEYGSIDVTFATEALNIIGDWLLAAVSGKGGNN
ncbi:MAG: alpha/beta fold hydrolase [Spirochaetales bacterium]|nr:MAG: alpha/beta fold hydrolase [Spirochaetales bacterium]